MMAQLMLYRQQGESHFGLRGAGPGGLGPLPFQQHPAATEQQLLRQQHVSSLPYPRGNC